MSITHDALDLTIHEIPDMFKLAQFGPHCTRIDPPAPHMVASGWFASLLECFLVKENVSK